MHCLRFASASPSDAFTVPAQLVLTHDHGARVRQSSAQRPSALPPEHCATGMGLSSPYPVSRTPVLWPSKQRQTDRYGPLSHSWICMHEMRVRYYSSGECMHMCMCVLEEGGGRRDREGEKKKETKRRRARDRMAWGGGAGVPEGCTTT